MKLAFRGSAISSDGGLLLQRELDDALGLTDLEARVLADTRTMRNGRHHLGGLVRQSIFSRLAGYEDVNDAAASASAMGRFETGMLTRPSNFAVRAARRGSVGIIERAFPSRQSLAGHCGAVSPCPPNAALNQPIAVGCLDFEVWSGQARTGNTLQPAPTSADGSHLENARQKRGRSLRCGRIYREETPQVGCHGRTHEH